MTLTVTTSATVPPDVAAIGVPVAAGDDGPEVLGDAAGIDTARLLARLDADGFAAGAAEATTVAGLGGDDRVVVAVGVGPRADVGPAVLRRAAAAAVRAARSRASLALVLLDAAPAGSDVAACAQALAEGARLGAYRFTRFKSSPEDATLTSVVVVGDEAAGPGIERGVAVAEGVALARDLINTPPGDLAPVAFAAVAEDVASRGGLAVEVVDEEAAADLALGGLLGVGRGSDNPPRMVKLTWTPDGAARGKVALVGKGITFDSGGLSLKSGEGMMGMKTDMSGAAAVLGAMSVLPVVRPDVEVVAWLCLAENMPSGRATRPGDVLTIRNGTTVEVLNTDAEGRLVLADGLSLAVEAGVDAIVDLATLTGACIVALGPEVAGLMGNDETWSGQVSEAAARADEEVWPLPLPPSYRRMLDSDVADIKNIGGKYAGALTAGLFLQEFVGTTPWVHLDIAGPSNAEEDRPLVPKGGTGFGVRTLVELLENFTPPAAGS
jgi:leucyl aminopeptidase